MILGLHIRDSKNAGDRWSTPLEYFDFPGREVVCADMRTPPECLPELVIYGGGSITASPDFHGWPCPVVAWGVGHHVRRPPWRAEMQGEHTRAAALCAQYFPRDSVESFAVTPCASCMHPVFDEELRPVHPVVRYSAARRVDVADGIAPHMTNEDGTIEEAVRFLASGEVVVTSSYHGAYWAGLLGREVRIVPWGSKFEYLPKQSLAECRAANRRAYAAVLELLDGPTH